MDIFYFEKFPQVLTILTPSLLGNRHVLPKKRKLHRVNEYKNAFTRHDLAIISTSYAN